MRLDEAVLVCLRKYATVSGRARRPEFWWFLLAQTVVVGAVATAESRAPALRGVPSLLVWLALLPPGAAATVRRLHDLGLGGWVFLLAVLASLVLGLAAGLLNALLGIEGRSAALLLTGLSWAPTLLLLALLARPSQTGANRYGPEPVASAAEAR